MRAVSQAVVDYLGFGRASFPQDERSALDQLQSGERKTFDAIMAFADRLEPNWDELNLLSSGNWARDQLKAEFPALENNALDALAWACTFGWK